MDTTTGVASPERDEAAFRAAVVRLRKEKGWSQNRLAKEMQNAGFTEYRQATVARLENGERTIKLGESRIIAKLFDTSVEKMISMSEIANYTNLLERYGYSQFEANTELYSAVVSYLRTRERSLRGARNPVPYSELDPQASPDSELVEEYNKALERLRAYSQRQILDVISDGLLHHFENSWDIDFQTQIISELELNNLKSIIQSLKDIRGNMDISMENKGKS